MTCEHSMLFLSITLFVSFVSVFCGDPVNPWQTGWICWRKQPSGLSKDFQANSPADHGWCLDHWAFRHISRSICSTVFAMCRKVIVILKGESCLWGHLSWKMFRLLSLFMVPSLLLVMLGPSSSLLTRWWATAVCFLFITPMVFRLVFRGEYFLLLSILQSLRKLQGG